MYLVRQGLLRGLFSFVHFEGAEDCPSLSEGYFFGKPQALESRGSEAPIWGCKLSWESTCPASRGQGFDPPHLHHQLKLDTNVRKARETVAKATMKSPCESRRLGE